MEAVLIALGIPEVLAPLIAGIPVSYLIPLIILIAALKYKIVPSIIKYFNGITDSILQLNKKVDKIQTIVEELGGDNIGSVDDALALSQFLSIMNSAHLRTQLFFQYRLKVNHFIGSEDIISSRYNSKATELTSKVVAQMNKFHLNGVFLSSFFVNNGCESYFRHLFAELFDAQALKARGELQSLSDDDIASALETNLNILGDMFKNWIRDNTNTYVKQKSHNDLRLIKRIEEDDVANL